MLPVYDISVSRKGIRAINDRIFSILERAIDWSDDLENIKSVEFLFPEHLLIEKPEWCVKKLKQFRSMIKDDFERDYLDPIYEYILYQLLQDEIAFLKDMGELSTFSYEEFFDENGEQINLIPENYYVEDISQYLDFMFRDYDFLIVSNGLKSELEEYFDIMPEDIRETVKRELKEKESDCQKEEGFIKTIISAIEQIENQPTLYEKCSEPQINDHIASIVKQYLYTQGIALEREKPQGFAIKGSGEVDFYVSDITTLENLAIGESKNALLFDRTLKQLLGYMTRNTRFGFTININHISDLAALKNQIVASVKNDYCEQQDFKLVDLIFKEKYIVSIHLIPEETGKFIRIYHLILNLKTESRREIAKEARMK